MIILNDKIEVVEKYKGGSKFDFWHNLQVGDILIISMPLKPTGRNGGRTYAPTIKAYNERTMESFNDSINSIQRYLGKITFKEYLE